MPSLRFFSLLFLFSDVPRQCFGVCGISKHVIGKEANLFSCQKSKVLQGKILTSSSSTTTPSMHLMRTLFFPLVIFWHENCVLNFEFSIENCTVFLAQRDFWFYSLLNKMGTKNISLCVFYFQSWKPSQERDIWEHTNRPLTSPTFVLATSKEEHGNSSILLFLIYCQEM